VQKVPDAPKSKKGRGIAGLIVQRVPFIVAERDGTLIMLHQARGPASLR
jgi:hypothetical protein